MTRKKLFVESVIALVLASTAAPISSTVLTSGNNVTTVQAATDDKQSTSYTAKENQQVLAFQKQYQKLVQADSFTNIYSTTPNLSTSFAPGALKPAVIENAIGWINYYRSLAGLPNVIENTDSNQLAQISSSVMAYAQSNPYLNQHNLANTTRPDGLSDMYWNRAVLGTGSSNLYFGYPKTIASPIRELMLDNTNVDGLDAGHRAWFLSPVLSTVGVGIATSTSTARQYESIVVKNGADAFRTPAVAVVQYPSSGLFPVEEMTSDSGSTVIPWSISFSSQENLVDNDKTKITVTNLTDGTTGTVSPSYSGSQAYSKTTMSFIPPANVTINDHSQYKVTVSGLNSNNMSSYSYTFKTFSENGSGVKGTVISSESSDTENTADEQTITN